MPKAKVAVTLDEDMLKRLERLVREGRYANRSQAMESVLGAGLERVEGRRLAEECAKLDPAEEQAMADEGLEGEAEEWPEY